MRALVIEGGGAKGAFAFGCLLALKERSIDIDMVSGTSVGALNALLWSTKSLPEGERMWKGISPATTYRKRRTPVDWIFGPVQVLSELYFDRFDSTYSEPDLGDRTVKLVFGAIDLVLCTGPMLFMGLGLLFDREAFWTPIYGVIMLLFCLGCIQTPRMRIIGLAINLFSGVLTTGYLLVKAVQLVLAGKAHLLSSFAQDLAHFHWTGRSLGISFDEFALTLGNGIFTLAVVLGASLLRLLSSTAYDSVPLRATVATFTGLPITIPTFVTTAKKAWITDPDDFAEQENVLENDYARTYQIESLPVWLPTYHALPGEVNQRAIDLVMASAALPFGIVSPVVIDGVKHSDGGTADNLPIWPVMSNGECDEVIVIRVNPIARDAFTMTQAQYNSHWMDAVGLLDDNPVSYENYWKVTDRRVRYQQPSANVPRPNLREMVAPTHFENPPKAFPFRGLPVRPARVITIAPKQRLGNFTATMNMRSKFTSPLIAAGKKRALEVLEEYFPSPLGLDGVTSKR